MPTAFAEAFTKKAEKVFEEANTYKHKEGGGFGPVDIPDGTYSAVVTIKTGVSKEKKIPYARVQACVTTGPHEGKEPSQGFFFEGKPPVPADSEEMPTDEQKFLGLLAWLLPDLQVDSSDQVEDAIAEVNTRGPLCIIGTRTAPGKTNKNKIYQNVYFNKLVQPATFDQPEGSTDKSEGTDYVPAAGDTVFITDEGEDILYKVNSVSQARQTANLENKEDKSKRNGISWGDLTKQG